MINKFIISIAILVLTSSCASNSTRRPILKTEVTIRGGSYDGKQWDDKIIFQRISWYRDATATHEVLTTKLTGESSFSNWLGSDKLQLSTCQELRVVMVYASASAEQGASHLLSEMTQGGFEQISLLDFSQEIKAHHNFHDWNLQRHKIYGLCLKQGQTDKSINITIPGFKNYKVL